jgi:hypothetical protein
MHQFRTDAISPAQKAVHSKPGLSPVLHRGADYAQQRHHVQKWKECCGELHQIFRLSLVALLLLVTFQVKYLLLRSNPAVHIFTAHATRHLTRIPHQWWLCFAWHGSSTQFLLARCSHRLMCWPTQASSVVSEHFSSVRVSRDAPGAHARTREVTGAQ